jgi:hypothetical protein
MHNFFYDTYIDVADDFIEQVKNFIDKKSIEDWKHILNMKLLPVPLSMLEKEDKLLKIVKKYKAEVRLAIYDTEPNTAFHWHTDKSRYASLNILIDGWDSKCLFSQNEYRGMRSNLVELHYEKNRVYLLDVTKEHCVLNFNNPRYMFSIGIPVPATFDEVKEFIQQL